MIIEFNKKSATEFRNIYEGFLERQERRDVISDDVFSDAFHFIEDVIFTAIFDRTRSPFFFSIVERLKDDNKI